MKFVFSGGRKTLSLWLTVSWLAIGWSTAIHAESLYREGGFRPLIADNKAFRIGDALTVQIIENSSASTTADTETRRKHGLTGELAHGATKVGQTSASLGSDFDGGGSTKRANRLLATITVVVREILPNGDLKVAGEQLVTVNEEPQKVTLVGRVRPVDISDGNVVLSTRLADAKITYLGDGEVADRAKRPWWRKFLDWVGV